METLSSEQIRELKEHQPIPYGFWKMLGGTIATLVLLGNCVWIGFSALTWFKDLPGDLEIAVSAIPMCFAMLFIAIYAIAGARGRWISDYWRRDVSGYVARFYHATVTGEDGKELRELRYLIVTRRENADFWLRMQQGVPSESIAISLPLGGWFAQSWIRGMDRDQIECLYGWSVEFRAILNTDLVMVEIRKRNRFWGIDERIVTDVGSALRHLEYVVSDSTALNRSWSDIVHYLDRGLVYAQREREELEQQKTALFGILHESAGNPSVNGDTNAWMIEQVRRLIAERDAARGEVDRYKDGFLPAAVKDRDEARQERDAAITFIKSVMDDVEASSRMVNTIEGLKVLHSVVYWLRSLYFGKEQLPQWEERYKRVCQLLEDKELRARRRHGKAKAPAPAA